MTMNVSDAQKRRDVLKTISTILLLFVATTLTAYERPLGQTAQAYDYRDWQAMNRVEQRLFIEGFAAGQLTLVVDFYPYGEDFVDHMRTFTILRDPLDTIVSHVTEIYSEPGFRDVPLAIAIQLAHHYVEQIRDGYRRPQKP